MGGDLDEGWRPRRLRLAKSQRPLVFLCELIRPVFSSVFALWPVDFETRSLPINGKNRTIFTYAECINFFILSCYKKGVKSNNRRVFYVKMLLILLYDNRKESDESSKQ